MLHRGSLRWYMHIRIWSLNNVKVFCITHDGERTQCLKKNKKSQKYTKNKCASNYIFFKEVWSSSCIDCHDLDIISNFCLHRNCQVVSLQTFKNHFTLLISLEFLVVLSYHLVTQIMYNTLCFIIGILNSFKVDVMNAMTQLSCPQAPQKCWNVYHINNHR